MGHSSCIPIPCTERQPCTLTPGNTADRLWTHWTEGKSSVHRLLVRLAEREARPFNHSFAISELESGYAVALGFYSCHLPLAQRWSNRPDSVSARSCCGLGTVSATERDCGQYRPCGAGHASNCPGTARFACWASLRRRRGLAMPGMWRLNGQSRIGIRRGSRRGCAPRCTVPRSQRRRVQTSLDLACGWRTTAIAFAQAVRACRFGSWSKPRCSRSLRGPESLQRDPFPNSTFGRWPAIARFLNKHSDRIVKLTSSVFGSVWCAGLRAHPCTSGGGYGPREEFSELH